MNTDKQMCDEPKTQMAIWNKQLVIRPNSVARADDILEQLIAMVRRARRLNCFQINRSEIESLKAGDVPDAIHLHIGAEPAHCGIAIDNEVWTEFDQRFISNVRVANTKFPFGISFPDYVSFGLSNHSLNKPEIDLASLVSDVT